MFYCNWWLEGRSWSDPTMKSRLNHVWHLCSEAVPYHYIHGNTTEQSPYQRWAHLWNFECNRVWGIGVQWPASLDTEVHRRSDRYLDFFARPVRVRHLSLGSLKKLRFELEELWRAIVSLLVFGIEQGRAVGFASKKSQWWNQYSC